MIRWKVLLVSLASCAVPAFAQNVITVPMMGQPLVYMKDGAVQGCGVRVLIVDAPPTAAVTARTVPIWDTSFNISLPGYATIKAGSLDVPIAEIRAGRFAGAGRPVEPTVFWFKAKGTSATKPVAPQAKVIKGEDPGTILYVADVASVLPLFSASNKRESILVGTRWPGGKSDRIFSGTIEMSPKEFEQVTHPNA
jgi:hypothetical protein